MKYKINFKRGFENTAIKYSVSLTAMDSGSLLQMRVLLIKF